MTFQTLRIKWTTLQFQTKDWDCKIDDTFKQKESSVIGENVDYRAVVRSVKANILLELLKQSTVRMCVCTHEHLTYFYKLCQEQGS